MIVKRQFIGIFLKNWYLVKNEKKFFILFWFFPILISGALKLIFDFNIDKLIYVLLFFGLLQNVELQRKLLISIVYERYIGFKIHNKIIGLTETSYISSELSFYYLKGLLCIFIINISSYFFSSKNLEIQILFNYLYLMVFCSVNFILLVSLFIKSPNVASDLSQVMFIILNIICLIYGWDKKEPNFWFSFLPQFNFYILAKEIIMFKVLKVKIIGSNKLFIYSFIWGIIYLLLFFYFEIIIKNLKFKNKIKNFFNFFKNSNINNNNTINKIEFELYEDKKSIKNNNFENGLTIKNLYKSYGSFLALKNINCNFEKGKITCVLGHNGAGKSTLINTICGILSKDKGLIELDKLNIEKDSDYLKSVLGYCSAKDILFEDITVEEHLIMKFYIKNLIYTSGRVNEIMSKIDLLRYKNYKVKELSGGNKRKLSIALSLIGNIKILFLDEPSSNLDPFSRREIWKIIKKFKEENCIIILATHHMDEVEFLSDKIILLENGKIKADGTLIEFKKLFGEGNLFNFNSNDLPNLYNKLLNIKEKFINNSNIFLNNDMIINEIKNDNIKVKINNNTSLYFDILKEINRIITENDTITFKTKSIEKIYLKFGKTNDISENISEENLMNLNNKNYLIQNKNSVINKSIQLIRRRFLFLILNFNQIIIYLLHNFCIFLILYGIVITDKNGQFVMIFKKSKYKVISMLLFIDFVSCFTNSSIIYFLVYEKKFNIKHFLYLNKISHLNYSISTIIADIIIQLIPYSFFFFYFGYYIYYKNQTELWDFNNFIYLLIYLIVSKINYILYNYWINLRIFSNPNNSIKYNGLIWYLTLIISSILLSITPSFLNLNYIISSLVNPYIINIILFHNSLRNSENVDIYNIYFKNNLKFQWVSMIWILFVVNFIKNKISKYFESKPESNYNSNIDNESIEKEIEKIYKNNKSNLKIKKWGKKYKQGNPSACYNINLLIKEKETLSLLGYNGAGKSTVINMIIELIRKGEGDIFLLNKNQENYSSFLKNRIGVCIQLDSLWNDFTVKEHLNIYRKILNTNNDFNNMLINFLKLEPHINKRVYELSSGNKRKLNFALSLLGNPNLLILDEATSGVDVEMRYKIKNYLNYLKKKNNLSIWLTTHIMSEAEILSDKIALMKKGELVFVYDIKDLKKKEKGYYLNLYFERDKMDTSNVLYKLEEYLTDKKYINDLQELSNIEIKILLNNIQNPIGFIIFWENLKQNNYFIDYNIRNLSLEDIFILNA